MTKTVKFEESLKRLEQIVEEMEGCELDLDKSLSMFEEGIKLVHFCSSKLEETKKKIEILVKKGDKMVKEPFASEDKSESNKDLFE
jgi:exodeoxyribonuclease VII small subunit